MTKLVSKLKRLGYAMEVYDAEWCYRVTQAINCMNKKSPCRLCAIVLFEQYYGIPIYLKMLQISYEYYSIDKNDLIYEYYNFESFEIVLVSKLKVKFIDFK